MRSSATCWCSDDGFLVPAPGAAANVCCLDATNPFGYGRRVAARSPARIARRTVRARPVVITRAEQATAAEIDAIRAEVLRHTARAREVRRDRDAADAVRDVRGSGGTDVASLSGHQVLLASGSAIRGLRAHRADALRAGPRPRREGRPHAWTAAEAADLAKTATALRVDSVVTTAKDAVKLAELPWPAGAPPLGASRSRSS